MPAGLHRLTCPTNGNQGVVHVAWVRLVVWVVAQLDRLFLCGVAHGSSLEQELYPRTACGKLGKAITVLAVLAAVGMIFMTGSFSSMLGLILH